MNNPYFTQLIDNKAIQQLATKQRWTISTSEKIPIDMNEFISNGKIVGAKNPESPTLIDLKTLNENIPNAANYAFYLNAPIDEVVVIDIEPKCPLEVKQKLFKLPALYRELSMSGEGVHLIMPFPIEILNKYPDAMNKKVFKHPEGWYEILFNHYVTFTGKSLTPPAEIDDNLYEQIVEELAKIQKPSVATTIDIDALQEVNAPGTKFLICHLSKNIKHFKKTLADYGDDPSRYEFAVCIYLYHRLKKLVNLASIQRLHTFTDSEKAWIVAHVAKKFLDDRPKHNEMRNGLPWLIFVANNAINTVELGDI